MFVPPGWSGKTTSVFPLRPYRCLHSEVPSRPDTLAPPRPPSSTPKDVDGAVRAPFLDGQRGLVPKACVLSHGPENFLPLLASFAFFGSCRFATPHRPGGTGVIEGAVITGLGAGVVE
jgi:hypothetical protein